MRWSLASESETAAPQQAVPSSSATPVASDLPADHPPVPDGVDACPVSDSARSVWLKAEQQQQQHPMKAAPAAPEAKATYGPASLSVDREISTIPRAAGSEYRHNAEQEPQPKAADGEATGNWVYPSEQQFFNAMLRKQHNPRVADMRTIVPIHNAVNEKAWEEVLAWEAHMGADRCGGPRLSSFVGRPQDRTPKAWIKTALGYTPPFDRHDWIVDRCGTQVRYVIDFYTGKTDPNRPGAMSFYLDVRPAVDNWEGIKTRLSRFWS